MIGTRWSEGSADVIDAYRRLRSVMTGQPDQQPSTRPPRLDDLVDLNEFSETPHLGPTPRLVQVTVASRLVFGTSVLLLFFLVALSPCPGQDDDRR